MIEVHIVFVSIFEILISDKEIFSSLTLDFGNHQPVQASIFSSFYSLRVFSKLP